MKKAEITGGLVPYERRANESTLPGMLAINMLVATEDGCVFSVEELKQLLLDAGFCDPRGMRLPLWEGALPIMTARK